MVSVCAIQMTREQIILYLQGADDATLFALSAAIKQREVGDKVYLRGLIELGNRCRKNCLYCGIRRDNTSVVRYELSVGQVIEAAKYAYENGYGSLVIQSGEQQSERFTDYICELVSEIKELSSQKLGITLSLGEQSESTYQRWFNAGAHRYLLRIESSSPQLYSSIHPADHLFDERILCLKYLRSTGYQVGTGVMIGLPGQALDNLAEDLLFLRDFNIDMCGMGPYIEHPNAPLVASQYTLDQRFKLSLRMIALLRILMPDINIAATTALHAIDPTGREQGIAVGANIIMPNITPPELRASYKLYNNKPLTDIDLSGFNVASNEWGDSKHFSKY